VDGGTITGIQDVGGLAGRAESPISNSWTNVTVTGEHKVGGLYGFDPAGVITHSDNYSLGAVNGIAGGSRRRIAGLVGEVNDDTHLNSFARGNVVAADNNDVAGLIGLLVGGTVKFGFSTGDVSNGTARGGIGGFVGNVSTSSLIEDSYHSGDVSNVANAGGFLGKIFSSSIVRRSYAIGNITTCGDECGGFAGYVNSATLENVYATGNVTSTGIRVGGLVGNTSGGITVNGYATGTVDNGTSNDIGGAFGVDNGSSHTQSNIFATGDVIGTGTDVGRLTGQGDGGTNGHFLSTSACVGCDNALGSGQSPVSYFYNPANVPMTAWNFSTTWKSRNGLSKYPVLETDLPFGPHSVILAENGATSIVADGATYATLQATVTDRDNAVIVGTSVTLTIPANGGVVATNPVITDGSGVAEFVVTSSTVAATYAYTATVTANSQVSNSFNLEFIPGAPNAITLAITGLTSIEANGATFSTLRASVYDINDNFVGAGQNVTLYFPNGTRDVAITAANNEGHVVANGIGTTSGGISDFILTSSTKTGTYGYTAIVDAVTSSPARSIEFTPGVPAAITLAITGATSIAANSTAFTTLQASVYDTNDNLVASGKNVTLYFPLGTRDVAITATNNEGHVAANGVATSSSGVSEFILTSSSVQGTYGFTAIVDAITSAPNQDVEFGSPCISATTYDAAGSGLVGDPYLICEKEQLTDLGATSANSRWAKYYRLENDIDMTGESLPMEQIGDSTTAFTGTFDGNNFEVQNYSRSSASDGNAFFGEVDGDGVIDGLNDGQIIDFGLKDVTIGTQGTPGALVSKLFSSGRILRSYVDGGTVTTTSNIVGGLVGECGGNGTQINQAWTNVVVNSAAGAGNAGGIAGWVFNGCDVLNSYSLGKVSGPNEVGGIAGKIWNGGDLTNTYSLSQVSSPGSNVGGLVGFSQPTTNTTTITNSFATGYVFGASGNVGGLIGNSSDDTDISNSYATGLVKGSAYLGGFAGRHYDAPSSIIQSYSTGNVEGTAAVSHAGGLVGRSSTGDITDSYSRGNVTGLDSTAGLVASTLGTPTITRTYSTGKVRGNGTDEGGFLATAPVGTYTDNFWNASLNSGKTSAGTNTWVAGVFLKLQEEMERQETFQDHNFDFITTPTKLSLIS